MVFDEQQKYFVNFEPNTQKLWKNRIWNRKSEKIMKNTEAFKIKKKLQK